MVQMNSHPLRYAPDLGDVPKGSHGFVYMDSPLIPEFHDKVPDTLSASPVRTINGGHHVFHSTQNTSAQCGLLTFCHSRRFLIKVR